MLHLGDAALKAMIAMCVWQLSHMGLEAGKPQAPLLQHRIGARRAEQRRGKPKLIVAR